MPTCTVHIVEGVKLDSNGCVPIDEYQFSFQTDDSTTVITYINDTTSWKEPTWRALVDGLRDTRLTFNTVDGISAIRSNISAGHIHFDITNWGRFAGGGGVTHVAKLDDCRDAFLTLAADANDRFK